MISSQLTLALYEKGPSCPAGLFGLTCGQQRKTSFVKDGGWYNQDAERLGWGDLSVPDLQTIRDEISTHELFMVMTGANLRLIWGKPVTEEIFLRVEKYSLCGYVHEKVFIIIARDQLFLVDRLDIVKEATCARDNLLFTVLTQDMAKELIVEYQEKLQ